MPPSFLLILSTPAVMASLSPPNASKGLTKASPPPSSRPVPYGSPLYFLACSAGGVVAAGGTHLVVTPLDVIKCRMQTNAGKYPSVMETARITVAEDGIRGLARGWAPTLVGYSLQGFAKFGLYEVFKLKYSQFLGEDTAHKYRSLIYLAAASSAEVIGDVVLAPFEAAKVRTQTDPKAPRQMMRCFPLIYRETGLNGLYRGLPPLAMRQVPYTCAQFITFEFAMEALYKYCVPKPRSQCSKTEQMSWSLVGACIAGVMATVCSHQPDILVSILNKNPDLSYKEAIGILAKNGIWKGLQARLMMIATAAAMQLFIVDATKVIFNLEIPKQK